MTCFEPEIDETLVSNPAVEAALEQFAAQCGDPVAGLTDRDRGRARRVFAELEVAGESFDPDEIELWAWRRGGFDRKSAAALSALAAQARATRAAG
jgi:hypothetical protein